MNINIDQAINHVREGINIGEEPSMKSIEALLSAYEETQRENEDHAARYYDALQNLNDLREQHASIVAQHRSMMGVLQEVSELLSFRRHENVNDAALKLIYKFVESLPKEGNKSHGA
jgi:antitoxin component HigA of HigAB toxin-antitoxin module